VFYQRAFVVIYIIDSVVVALEYSVYQRAVVVVYIFIASVKTIMASSVSSIPLPHPAVFIEGRQKGSSILLDPQGYKLRFKHGDDQNKFYRCTIPDCGVRVTLCLSTNEIVSVRGEHLHDNSLIKDKIDALVKETVAKALDGGYSKPRVTWTELTGKVASGDETKDGVGKNYFFVINNFVI
jgi:hypothetical protein